MEYHYPYSSVFFNKFVNLFDPKTNTHLDKNIITRLLESNGFKIVDITELNGQYYFASQNKRKPV